MGKRKANLQHRTLATAMEQSPAGIIVSDAEGNVVLANQAAMRLYG